MRLLVAMLSAGLCACGDNVTPVDASQVAPGFQPAPHTPLPQISGHSNTVLSSVRLVTITYADDVARAQLDAFGALVVGSAWYQGVGYEYGVHAGSQVAKVHLGASPPSLTSAQAAQVVQQVVAQQLAPAPTSRDYQLLYMLHVPAKVGHAMLGEHGFHTEIIVHQVRAALAIVIDDAAPTVGAARMLIDASTDPYAEPDDGFYADPPANDPWSLVPGEVADLCDAMPAVALDDDHGELLVPRVYSNAAALGNKASCRPAEPDEVWTDVSADPSRIPRVVRGGQVTFHLTGWSTAQTADWALQLEAVEGSSLSLLQLSPELGDATINNGGRTQLILHAPITADLGETGAVYVRSGPSAQPWVVAIKVE
ncbi:MAG TPA: hypothetical protein VGC42_23430 [Kofleriaceae bacterium]